MIRGCIFDLGGTLIDKYSLTPFLALKKIFKEKDIHVNNQIIFKDIGKFKKDHISDILFHKNISNQWKQKYNREPESYDIIHLYSDFNRIQSNYCWNLMSILPEVPNCIQYLKKNNIKIGCTTGFNKEHMNIIRKRFDINNISLDSYISSTCLNKPSRPYPYMIEENMKNLNINDPKTIIKIDDTALGIQEGKNSNCWTVGVARWSINMNLHTIEEAYSLDIHELDDNLKRCRKRLFDSGADFVINTLDELPFIIHKINNNI